MNNRGKLPGFYKYGGEVSQSNAVGYWLRGERHGKTQIKAYEMPDLSTALSKWVEAGSPNGRLWLSPNAFVFSYKKAKMERFAQNETMP